MAKKFSKKFYDSDKWRKCRADYIAERISIDGGICEICRDKPGYIVHHETILNESNINDADITLDHNKLKYVCKECHDKLPGHFNKRRYKKSKATRSGFKFDSSGQLINYK